MEGSTGFGIDSILSHRAGSPAGPKGDPLGGDGRSPLELSPRSEGSSGCPSPRSPGRECLEAAGPHLQPGQGSAPSQSRTVTSSFLIRDILADCKPLAACAPYSSTNGPHGGQEPAGRIPTKPGEDFREKMEKTTSSSSSDSEYKGKKKPLALGGVFQGSLAPKPQNAPGAPRGRGGGGSGGSRNERGVGTKSGKLWRGKGRRGWVRWQGPGRFVLSPKKRPGDAPGAPRLPAGKAEPRAGGGFLPGQNTRKKKNRNDNKINTDFTRYFPCSGNKRKRKVGGN